MDFSEAHLRRSSPLVSAAYTFTFPVGNVSPPHAFVLKSLLKTTSVQKNTLATVINRALLHNYHMRPTPPPPPRSFPQFGPAGGISGQGGLGTLQQHGFARNLNWKVRRGGRGAHETSCQPRPAVKFEPLGTPAPPSPNGEGKRGEGLMKVVMCAAARLRKNNEQGQEQEQGG